MVDEPIAKLSAVYVVRDEELALSRSLEAAAFCDEILVVDTGSRDDTVRVARTAGARVVDLKLIDPRLAVAARDTFYAVESAVRQAAISEAEHDWIFMVDADEVVTPRLRDSVLAAIDERRSAGHAYELRRRTMIGDRPVRCWSSSRVLRLFHRSEVDLEATGGPHDRVRLRAGEPGQLDGWLLHYSYEDIDDYRDKFYRYTTAEAEGLRARGARVRMSAATMRALKRGLRMGIWERALLDGPLSWRLVAYSMLYELRLAWLTRR